MEYVIKRNGVKAPFDKSKIVNAIEKAMTTTPGGIDSRVSNAIADHIAEMPDTLSVEQIQDIVIEQLKASPFADVAESYSHWRKLRQEIRDKEKTNASILEIIDAKNDAINQENSNKNPTVNSVQRDYMAGEVSKDLTARLLLDPEIVKAHEDGLIHFHDADYFAQHMHNCFKSNTRFVTDGGVKEFRDFNDGEMVKVIGADGKWHTATVKKYGKQKMQDVMLQSGRSIKHIFCTANHRWLLNDGSVTTNLAEGMTLALLPELVKFGLESKEDYQAWATGFAIGDGLDKSTNYTTIRLCGEKSKYADYFVKAGDTVTYPKSYHGDAYVLHKGAFKQDFLNAKAWRFFDSKKKQHLFDGFYAADGAVKTNKVATADDRVAEMIRDISSVAGFYIASESEIVRDTNFKKNARLIDFRFRKHQIVNNPWIVKRLPRIVRKLIMTLGVLKSQTLIRLHLTVALLQATVTLSIWTTCSRTALLFLALALINLTASPPPATSPPRSLRRWHPTSTAVKVLRCLIWLLLWMFPVRRLQQKFITNSMRCFRMTISKKCPHRKLSTGL